MVVSGLDGIDKKISQDAADGILQKPVHMHVMQQTIKELIETDFFSSWQSLIGFKFYSTFLFSPGSLGFL